MCIDACMQRLEFAHTIAIEFQLGLFLVLQQQLLSFFDELGLPRLAA